MASAEVDAGVIHLFNFLAGKMIRVPLSMSDSRSCMRSATGLTGAPRAPTCVLPRKHQPQIADRDLPNQTDKKVLAPARCGVYAPCLGETTIIMTIDRVLQTPVRVDESPSLEYAPLTVLP